MDELKEILIQLTLAVSLIHLTFVPHVNVSNDYACIFHFTHASFLERFSPRNKYNYACLVRERSSS